jgi:photosystem II stability/assembly factor-like uncharacterized protein
MLLLKSSKVMLVIIWLMFSSDIFSQWETQNSGVTVDLHDVCFVDSLNGWVLGDSALILNTSNGGNDWKIQDHPDMSERMNRIQFVSEQVGYIVGNAGLIMITMDSGKSWSVSQDSFEVNFLDLSFVTEDEGWATGYKTYSDHAVSLIVHTTDGGNSWEKQLELRSNNQFGAKLFSAVKFQDDSTGWALAGDYVDSFSETYVYKTSDGGKSWSNVGIVQATPLITLRIAGKDTLWGGGLNFVTSSDGGYNWNYYESELGNASSLSPVDGLTGWAYFSNVFTDVKGILYTKDAGRTWSEELRLQDQYINAMYNIDRSLWIVGSDGLIMKKRWNYTSIGEEEPMIPKTIKLCQNYPNPFNPSTTIAYQLTEEANVELRIFDIAGTMIRVFDIGSQRAGYHSVIWDGKNDHRMVVSSGVYYYNLKTVSKHRNNFSSLSKRMVLIK